MQRQEAHLRPADPRVREQGAARAQPRRLAEADHPADADRRRARREGSAGARSEAGVAPRRSDAVRRDRNLMQRFPDEAAHRKAREKALDELRVAVKVYADAHRRADDGDARSSTTKRSSTSTSTSTSRCRPSSSRRSTRTMRRSRRSGRWPRTRRPRLVRINALYDAELARLRKLWGGAPAGLARAAAGRAGSPTAPATPRPSRAKPTPADASSVAARSAELLAQQRADLRPGWPCRGWPSSPGRPAR